ncbi:MAG: SRPBCC domain-containing protein [Pseudolabrys sp.]|jgi:predicted enzyme related to lactoylglutathione lyase
MSIATAVKPSLTIKRRFNAVPAKVFAAWTDPQKMMCWMGPAGVIRCEAENDLRVGGRYHIKMTMADDEHNVSGVYRQLVRNEKVVFTWAWQSTPERESLVTVTIKPDGDGSLMTLHHEQFFDEDARDRHNNGWTSTMLRLETYLHTEGAKPHGKFVWNELTTHDVEKAKKFYAAALGWSFDAMPAPNGSTYWTAKLGDQRIGGLFSLDPQTCADVPEGWLPYIAVDDVDARVRNAEKLGAKLMRPIFDVPGVGRIAILTEPGGAAVGWITPNSM